MSLYCHDNLCDELLVNGDPYDNNPSFYGYADPSIRKDPSSNNLWLAYSFPHIKNFTPSVSIHLANSVDNGNSWNFVKNLFEPIAMQNPADNSQNGYLDHETVNILPVQNYWCAVRVNYFIPQGGVFSQRPPNSFHITVLKANTPEDLTNGETSVIGSSITHTGWNKDQTLIPPELNGDYFFWNEPALYYDENLNKLY